MSFEKNFCPSPWIHMRVNNTGHFEVCRWATKSNRYANASLKNESPLTFFQKGMSSLRQQLLEGAAPDACQSCYLQETHGKINGRQRQMIKVGVNPTHFEKSMLSSPWINEFEYSYNNQGLTTQTPQDWQIDLGNYCNSGCVFCNPYNSSWIASEYKRIGLISEMPPLSWTDDPDQVNAFIDAIRQCDSLTYLHFIGGETLITPAFKLILTELINHGLHEKVTVGFTTNLVIWRQDIVDILEKFGSVNVGVSVECFHPLNDYIRYPSQIDVVQENFEQWGKIADQNNWVKILRVTPTILSINHIDTIYRKAWNNEWSVESCDFINEPTYMRPSVLPKEYREVAIKNLQSWIDSVTTDSDSEKIFNTRSPTTTNPQMIQDAQSYVSYLKNQPYEVDRLPDLVKFLKAIERSRGNSILTYLPEYEELLRSAGY